MASSSSFCAAANFSSAAFMALVSGLTAACAGGAEGAALGAAVDSSMTSSTVPRLAFFSAVRASAAA